jgi:ATP-dependent Clp protease ATP-binding subunit ClpA
MPTRFARDARRAVERSRDVARERGARTLEAEHVLSALAEGAGVARGCLDDAGLDRDGILEALEREEARSLAAAGVRRPAFDLPPPPPSPRTPRWGASAKLALQRSLAAAVGRGDRAIGAAHLLLGVLAAERGTVPRALEAAGVDRAALAARVGEAMDERGPGPVH